MKISLYKKFSSGSAALLIVILGLFVGLGLIVGLASVLSRGAQISRGLDSSTRALAIAESLEEDIFYRTFKGIDVDDTEVLYIGNVGSATSSATSTVEYDAITSIKTVSTRGQDRNYVRKKYANLIKIEGASFAYGVQSDLGGTRLQNSSQIHGNAFSNGPVRGDNKNHVYGDVISAGTSGLMNQIWATTSYAHNITNSTIAKDAYYVTISNTTVGENSYPGSADQTAKPLPIADSVLDLWEDIAEDGQVISSPCPYVIDGITVTLGPAKIDCPGSEVLIKRQGVLNLTGVVWIVGNLTIKDDGSKIAVDASVGSKSVPVVVDDPADRENSSKVDLQNKSSFAGSGSSGSYVFLASRNNSSQSSGGVGGDIAIDVKNEAKGSVMLYAPHGNITIAGSSMVKEAAAYQILLKNSALLAYDTGMANTLFELGPGGAWNFLTWHEVQ